MRSGKLVGERAQSAAQNDADAKGRAAVIERI